MATSGKKGKKGKKQAVTLQAFHATGGSHPPATVQVTMSAPGNWADECEEDEEYDRGPQSFTLPTAPRSSRAFDDDSVPKSPPFLAHVSNLPYDVNDEDIIDFFVDFSIVQVRLPRDENSENSRLRGFGHVEFETREDLIGALSHPDPMIQGRRIKIDVSNENDQNQHGKRGGRDGRSRFDNFGTAADRDSTNWRRGGPPERAEEFNTERRGGGDRDRGFGYNRERNNADQEGGGAGGMWRRDGAPAREGGGGGGGRDGGGGVDRPITRNPDRGSFSTAPERGGSDRGGFRDGGDRGGFRDGGDRDRDRGGFRDNDRGNNFRRRDGPSAADTPPIPERIPLTILPRTLPPPEFHVIPDTVVESNGTSKSNSPEPLMPVRPKPNAASIFGQAKPVDTAAKEREIEERLKAEALKAKEELELKKQQQSQENESIDGSENEKTDAEKPTSEQPQKIIISVRRGADEKTNEKELDKEEEKPVAISWRRREPLPDNDEPENNKQSQSPSRARNYSPDRRGGNQRRQNNEDRRGGGGFQRENRDARDNTRDRERNFSNRGGDFGRRQGGDRDVQRDNRDNRNDRDYNNRGFNRDSNQKDRNSRSGQINRDDRPRRHDYSKDKDTEEIKDPEKMPKLQSNTGPNLQMSNKYENLYIDDTSE